MVAQAMGAAAVVVPLCLVAAWPLTAVQSQQPISHFDWHASSAAWSLSLFFSLGSQSITLIGAQSLQPGSSLFTWQSWYMLPEGEANRNVIRPYTLKSAATHDIVCCATKFSIHVYMFTKPRCGTSIDFSMSNYFNKDNGHIIPSYL